MVKEQDFYVKVAETLIEKLQEGVAPWQRPWEAGSKDAFPMNPTTGNRYRGGNLLFLMAQDYDDPRWMTYRQAEKIGAQVKKGEHGTPVIYWKFEETTQKKTEDGKPVLDAEGKPVTVTTQLERPRSFVSFVFNASQIDGLPPLQTEKQLAWNPVERAETILRDSGANIEHKAQGRAFYRPAMDTIVLPSRELFPSAGNYYDTALHELGHWTGHEKRLNRDMQNPFGSAEYAREELRAEISSMMLAGEIGLPHNTDNHAAYVQSWIQVLEEDPREIFRAAADAEKILEYVMALEQKQTLDQTRQPEAESVHDRQAVETQPAERHYLSVPFADKDEVKALGGKWDRQAKSWYVPSGRDALTFARWMQPADTRQQTAQPAEDKASRQYLVVPYTERRQARAAGARWDAEARSWYAGQDAHMATLEKWLPGKVEEQAPAMPPREEFAETLRSIGCRVEGDHPIMDGQKHRLTVEGDQNGEQSGFYVAHLDGRPAGYAKNNRSGEECRWKSAGVRHTPQEQAAFRQQCEEKKQERAAKLAALHEKTAQRIVYQLADLSPATEPTPYMVTKGIRPQIGAFAGKDGTTCLPAQDADGKLWTMQYIAGEGTKRFAKDGRKEGCFHAVGGTEALRKAPALVIAEGYATASSLSEALGFATVAAFDAGNLANVAKSLHEKYPDKAILLAGDDDRHHQNGNPGREKAERAAELVGGQTVFPVFAPGENGKDFSDFNDLAVKSTLGMEAVKRQVTPVLNRAIQEKQAELARTKTQEQQTEQRGHSR